MDYSRFDKIEDVAEDAPVVEDRDWYIDEKGVRRSRAADRGGSAAVAAELAGAASDPAIKKGFLDNAKTALYPKGSEQRAPPSDEDLFKNFGSCWHLSMDGTPHHLQAEQEGLPPQARAPEVKKATINAKVLDRATPGFTLETDDNEGLLQLTVSTPGLESMQAVDLDVTERSVALSFPSSACLKPLKVELPAAVVPTGVKAKFSKKTRQLTVKMPLVLQVAKAG